MRESERERETRAVRIKLQLNTIVMIRSRLKGQAYSKRINVLHVLN